MLGLYYFSDKKHPTFYVLELQLFFLMRLSKGKDLKETTDTGRVRVAACSKAVLCTSERTVRSHSSVSVLSVIL